VARPSAASLSQPARLALGPDRSLYIADTSHTRIRKVDVSSNVISTPVPTVTQCSSTAFEAALSACNSNAPCSMTFDAAGRLFVAGTICGSGTSGANAVGILRVDGDGSVHYVAGRSSGITSDGVSARAAQIDGIDGIDFDAAGNLFFTDSNTDRVRKIDGATGLVTTVMGTGTAGSAPENVAASGQPVSDPTAIVMNPAGDSSSPSWAPTPSGASRAWARIRPRR
jgi:sugar lactone lactonase YvrE